MIPIKLGQFVSSREENGSKLLGRAATSTEQSLPQAIPPVHSIAKQESQRRGNKIRVPAREAEYTTEWFGGESIVAGNVVTASVYFVENVLLL